MGTAKLLLWLFVFSLPISLWAQTKRVTGRVTDPFGSPVALASVIEKGSSSGTTTDNQGNFTLTVQGPNPVLVFSYVGYETIELPVGDQSSLNVTLQLSEASTAVVVTAFGVRKQKKELGYATQEVSNKTLLESRQPNLVNALQGRVAGVQINSTGGAPGQGASIVIRGIKSLDPSKDNQPLFVIDGVVMDNSTNTAGQQAELRGMSNRAADINPDDVESVSILRGGAATALYGQAGSNGVILITTKGGRAGKLRVGLTTTYGIDNVNHFPDVQNKYTQGYSGEYDPESFWPTWGPTVEAAKQIDPTHPDKLYHHYKQGYQTGSQFRASVNMSGGTEKAMMSSSLSYFTQEGTIPFTDYRNISARLNATFRFSDKFTFQPSLYFINSGGLRYNADRFNESLTYWSPRWNVKDYINEDGTMKTYGNNNPIYGAATNQFKDDVNRTLGNIAFEYRPLDWLRFNYRLGMDYYADSRRYTAPGPKGLVDEIPYEDNGLGFVNEYRLQNRIINSNLMATLQKDWGTKFSTTLRVGNDVRDQTYNRVNAEGDELDIPDLLTLNNTRFRTNSEYREQYRIVSVFGDLSVGYNNYLFLTLTGRNDWSSALPQNNNSYFYPSVSLSGIISEMVKLPEWWNYLKARASWAQIGKDTDPYRINTYYGTRVLSSTGQVLWTRSNAKGDPNLKPEKTTTVELGAEMRFLNNRLGLDFSWYKLNSRDQIIPVAISPTTGFTSLITNAGEIENKGIEITLNATPVSNKAFSWDLGLNFSRNRNEVVSIKEGLTEIVVASQFGYAGSTVTMKYVPGAAVGNLYGSSHKRYYGDKTDDGKTIDYSLPIVINSSGSNAGFPARDGTQRVLGNSQPDWIAGLSNTFRYKNFVFSFLWDTQQGMERYNQLDNFMAAFGIAKYTENREQTTTFKGVLPDGTPNTQVVYYGQGEGPDGRDYGAGYYRNVYRSISENFVQDASWIRLRNVSLTYNLPAHLFSKTFIQDLGITVTGNNLILITDYNGYDPESSSFPAGSNAASGFAGFTYPALRSFLFSLNVNFK